MDFDQVVQEHDWPDMDQTARAEDETWNLTTKQRTISRDFGLEPLRDPAFGDNGSENGWGRDLANFRP